MVRRAGGLRKKTRQAKEIPLYAVASLAAGDTNTAPPTLRQPISAAWWQGRARQGHWGKPVPAAGFLLRCEAAVNVVQMVLTAPAQALAAVLGEEGLFPPAQRPEARPPRRRAPRRPEKIQPRQIIRVRFRRHATRHQTMTPAGAAAVRTCRVRTDAAYTVPTIP